MIPSDQHDQRSVANEEVSKHSSLPTIELALSGLLAFAFPASMSTQWGSLGAYVSAAISIISVVGVIRVRPTLAEIRRVTPFFMIALILAATLLAAMTEQYDWSYVRGTPVQWSAFLSVVSLVGLWQVRGGNPRRWVLWLLCVSAFISALAIYEYFRKDYVHLDGLYSALTGIRFDDTAYRRSPDSFRAISTLGNPLALGTLTAVGGAGALGFYLENASFWWLLVFIVNALAAFATLSRSSWLALLVSIVLLAIAYFLKSGAGVMKMHLHLLAGATIAVVLVSIPVSQEYILNSLEQSFSTASGRVWELADSISYSHRTEAPLDAASSMISKPHSLLIGFGLGAENNFFLGNTATPLTGITSKDAGLLRTFDNTYVTLGYSFGLLGLSWFIRLLFVRAWEAIRNVRHHYWSLGMLTAVAICLYFYNGISAPSASYLLASLLAFRIEDPSGRHQHE